MNWPRFKRYYQHFPDLDFAIDVSRMRFGEDFLAGIDPRLQSALRAMEELEGGAIANPDEDRMVGHYWLRDPNLAPTPEIGGAIRDTRKAIADFAAAIHAGELRGAAGTFDQLLLIGIGGSALGPQLVSQALGCPRTDRMRVHFFDNTDPEGIELVLAQIAPCLGNTLTLVISKSGNTPETRNGMLSAEHAYRQAGLLFARHAVAITGVDSQLDRRAAAEGWLARFPMWDWVGGRTSETGPVGLVAAALQGIDTDSLLSGAREMDRATRVRQLLRNPAALLAAMWYYATDGRGSRDMVILPYKDRLQLFARYLQQLIMESLGKALDRDGTVVNQGIAVYGNKGSTDQHAYVQQLREGIANFFVTFIEVLGDSSGDQIEVEPGVTSGDFLHGFYLGTRAALWENGRESITLTISELNPRSLGMLIALYERTVGIYASLVNINAYNQPGVEAGKRAAATALQIQARCYQHLRAHPGQSFMAEELAEAIEAGNETESIFKLLQHLAANPHKHIERSEQDPVFATTFAYLSE